MEVYYFKNDAPTVIYAHGHHDSQRQSPYHINEDEVNRAQDFIETTTIPETLDYIKLAHANYELSYNVNDDSLSFLTLMIALEVLFKPGRNTRFSEELSQNVGTLLGSSQAEIKDIQNEISELYNKRSDLVHEGKVVWCFVGEDDDVTRLRLYIRGSIKRIIQLNQLKDDLLEYLNIQKKSKNM